MISGRETTRNGADPELKRRRLLDAGGPIEDDETARQKMRGAFVGEEEEITGFEPDDIVGIKSQAGIFSEGYEISPMGYFCRSGDMPMVRWLYVNGADTRDENVGLCFPMYIAAVNGHIEICKWLCDRGAAQDVKRMARTPILANRPLRVTIGRPGHQNVSRWLILRGAMCKDFQSGELDADIIKEDLAGDKRYRGQYDIRNLIEERRLLLEWANDLQKARTSFLLFLSGSLSGPNHGYSTRRCTSPLRSLSGKAGVLQSIGDYVGIVRGREARIIRQLVELLPDLNKELDAEQREYMQS